VWESGCLVLESGVARRPLRGLCVVRRSQSLTVAFASEAVRRRWERSPGRKEMAVMETSPRRDGDSVFEGASEDAEGSLGLAIGTAGRVWRLAWASNMVLVERAYFRSLWVWSLDAESPSREEWSF